MNDITGYQPKGPPIVNPKPPRGGSSIMTHHESTPEPLADGYYWAKYNHEHADGRWLIAQVYDGGNGQRGLSKKVALTGVDLAFDLSSFTFGQRIEEPAKKHGDTIIGNFAEWRCPSCRAESWDTACAIANETWLNCKCGVRVKVVYPINNPPPASS